jgi:hypothetical protein
MFCDHKKTKQKLYAWAIDCRGKHEQGFIMRECCSACGCLADNKNKSQSNQPKQYQK